MTHSVMRAACLILFGATAAMKLSAQTQPEHPVDGPWVIAEGSYAGNEYQGDVSIGSSGLQKILRWEVGTGTYEGIGFYRDGMLYVGWGTGASYGLVLYTVRPNGTLDGTWSFAGNDEVPGTEHAVGGSLDEESTTYTVNGVNPGHGGEYSGTLAVRRTGETYQLHWEVGDDAYSGVGIRVGDKLVVGWGGAGKDFGVTAYAVEADRAVGRRALADRSEVGREVLARVVVATPGK